MPVERFRAQDKRHGVDLRIFPARSAQHGDGHPVPLEIPDTIEALCPHDVPHAFSSAWKRKGDGRSTPVGWIPIYVRNAPANALI